jgi:hypothetical protein
MRFLVVGWFSATAERHYSVKSLCGKCEAAHRGATIETVASHLSKRRSATWYVTTHPLLAFLKTVNG